LPAVLLVRCFVALLFRFVRLDCLGGFVVVVILRLDFKWDTIGHDARSVEDEHFGFVKFLANHLTLLVGFCFVLCDVDDAHDAHETLNRWVGLGFVGK
jgi:hypothetical protein